MTLKQVKSAADQVAACLDQVVETKDELEVETEQDLIEAGILSKSEADIEKVGESVEDEFQARDTTDPGTGIADNQGLGDELVPVAEQDPDSLR